MQVRTLIQRGFHQALEKVDVLVGPAAPTAAFELGTVINDPLLMYKNDVLTVGLNLAGKPALCPAQVCLGPCTLPRWSG